MSTGQTLQHWDTHEVLNQFDEYTDFNLLQADPALAEALQRSGAERHIPSLSRYAQQLGERATWELAEQANRHTPELHRFDTRGRIIDAVEFHPSWHALMGLYRQQGLVSLPFEDSSAGRWSAWAAGFYLHGQVEQGTLCCKRNRRCGSNCKASCSAMNTIHAMCPWPARHRCGWAWA
jgi:putative acyl-CoA dehydrogenase